MRYFLCFFIFEYDFGYVQTETHADITHKLAREKYLVVNRFPILLVVPFVNPPLLTHLLHPCKLIVIGRYVSRFHRSKIAFDFWRGFASVPRLIMNMTRRLNCNAGTVQ